MKQRVPDRFWLDVQPRVGAGGRDERGVYTSGNENRGKVVWGSGDVRRADREGGGIDGEGQDIVGVHSLGGRLDPLASLGLRGRHEGELDGGLIDT